MYHEYFNGRPMNKIVTLSLPFFSNYLRLWDVTSTNRVDYFISNSDNVRRRIKRYYNRDAVTIYPPVDTSYYTPVDSDYGDYYLIVSALVPYKRIDLAIETFNDLKLPLIIVGEGTEEKRLHKMSGSNIQFVGYQSPEKLRDYYNHCRALIFPGEEDFGIVPVEAQSCGRPVIAYRGGGALESVTEGKTGIFFNQLTKESLIQAIKLFDKSKFNKGEIRKHSLQFDRNIFKKNIIEYIDHIAGR
jgi:glycosyltransferase involved in cell wall biosynthesis